MPPSEIIISTLGKMTTTTPPSYWDALPDDMQWLIMEKKDTIEANDFLEWMNEQVSEPLLPLKTNDAYGTHHAALPWHSNDNDSGYFAVGEGRYEDVARHQLRQRCADFMGRTYGLHGARYAQFLQSWFLGSNAGDFPGEWMEAYSEMRGE